MVKFSCGACTGSCAPRGRAAEDSCREVKTRAQVTRCDSGLEAPRDRGDHRRKFWDNARGTCNLDFGGTGIMDIDALEREALKLPPEDRARLVRDLLDSLDELSAEEFDRLWLEEASQRAAQIDAGEVELISAEEVDRKARALLR